MTDFNDAGRGVYQVDFQLGFGNIRELHGNIWKNMEFK
jgi:hypothetical protein